MNKVVEPNELHIQKEIADVETKQFLTPDIFDDSSNFHGCVDEITNEEISGWVIDASLANIELEILIGDVLISLVQTKFARPDIDLLVEKPNINAGFKITVTDLDLSNFDTIPSEASLTIRVKGTNFYFNLDDFDEQKQRFLENLKPIQNTSFSEVDVMNEEELEKINKDFQLIIDGLLGKYLVGWAVCNEQGSQIINLHVDDNKLANFIASLARADVADVYGLDIDSFGFIQDIGGLLQFIALSESKPKISLNLDSDISIEKELAVENCIAEAISFTPMGLAVEKRGDLFPYYCNRASVVEKNTLQLNFTKINPNPAFENCLLQFYQISKEGILKQIASKNIDTKTQLINLNATLIDISLPVLLVIKELDTNKLILTDCIPYPLLLHSDHELMIELHSLYVHRQQHIHVSRRLQKHWLDYQTRQIYSEYFSNQKQLQDSFPNKTTTAIVFYSRESDTLIDSDLLPTWQHLAEKAYVLNRHQGLIATENLNSEYTQGNIKSFSDLNTDYVLFWDICAVIRPDYWSVINAYCGNPCRYKAISGNSIIYDGEFVPNYIGHKPLTNFPDNNFDFLPLATILVQKVALNFLDSNLEKRRCFLPENIAATLEENDIFHLRVPIDVKKESPLLSGEKRILDRTIGSAKNVTKMKFPKKLTEDSKQLGFSVVINFRNAAEVTNKALSALKLQEYSGNIEVILVNNCSHISAQQIVSSHAISLFGEEWVKIIDYPHPFNHSEQTNIAVEKATQPLLLMLSNDAFLLSPHCLQQAEEVLTNPQVATCGFQIVRLGGKGTEFNIESVGLQFALGQLCSLGGQLLKRNIPLNRHANKVMRVAGNTFAAVAIRTELFKQVGEMDTDRFPTTYNDVEFSLRASGEGFYHVVAGDCIVQHSGRGTREPDLDFPTEPKILASVKNINELADSYSVYNFGGLRVF